MPCNECGALILPATAESTGGVCMACKQGIRKSMEASKEYYKKLKEYDPAYELWKSLVNRSSDDSELTNWTKQEKLYFSVCLLEGEVYNGGFDQYFSNTSGDYYSLAIAGLDELGATHSRSLLKEAAVTLFGKKEPPASQVGRWQIMNSKARRLAEVVSRHRRASQLEKLDQQFWKDTDRLSDRLTGYAKEHGLVAPFEIDPN